MDSTLTTLFRCSVAALFLYAFCRWMKMDLKLQSKKMWIYVAGSAALLGAHWITYFYSLDLSNVALALLTLYSFPAITAVLEPLLTKTPFRLINIFLALMVMLGVYIMMPTFDMGHVHTRAIGLGLLSALLYSLRNIFVKRPSTVYNGSVLMFHQLWILVILLSPTLFFIEVGPIVPQLKGIILLGLFTTALGHTLFLVSLKYLDVIKASLLACIVPVYGILWAYFFLNEVPTTNTLIGGGIILITVVIATLTKKKVA